MSAAEWIVLGDPARRTPYESITLLTAAIGLRLKPIPKLETVCRFRSGSENRFPIALQLMAWHQEEQDAELVFQWLTAIDLSTFSSAPVGQTQAVGSAHCLCGDGAGQAIALHNGAVIAIDTNSIVRRTPDASMLPSLSVPDDAGTPVCVAYAGYQAKLETEALLISTETPEGYGRLLVCAFKPALKGEYVEIARTQSYLRSAAVKVLVDLDSDLPLVCVHRAGGVSFVALPSGAVIEPSECLRNALAVSLRFDSSRRVVWCTSSGVLCFGTLSPDAASGISESEDEVVQFDIASKANEAGCGSTMEEEEHVRFTALEDCFWCSDDVVYLALRMYNVHYGDIVLPKAAFRRSDGNFCLLKGNSIIEEEDSSAGSVALSQQPNLCAIATIPEWSFAILIDSRITNDEQDFPVLAYTEQMPAPVKPSVEGRGMTATVMTSDDDPDFLKGVLIDRSGHADAPNITNPDPTGNSFPPCRLVLKLGAHGRLEATIAGTSNNELFAHLEPVHSKALPEKRTWNLEAAEDVVTTKYQNTSVDDSKTATTVDSGTQKVDEDTVSNANEAATKHVQNHEGSNVLSDRNSLADTRSSREAEDSPNESEEPDQRSDDQKSDATTPLDEKIKAPVLLPRIGTNISSITTIEDELEENLQFVAEASARVNKHLQQAKNDPYALGADFTESDLNYNRRASSECKAGVKQLRSELSVLIQSMSNARSDMNKVLDLDATLRAELHPDGATDENAGKSKLESLKSTVQERFDTVRQQLAEIDAWLRERSCARVDDFHSAKGKREQLQYIYDLINRMKDWSSSLESRLGLIERRTFSNAMASPSSQHASSVHGTPRSDGVSSMWSIPSTSTPELSTRANRPFADAKRMSIGERLQSALSYGSFETYSATYADDGHKEKIGTEQFEAVNVKIKALPEWATASASGENLAAKQKPPHVSERRSRSSSEEHFKSRADLQSETVQKDNQRSTQEQQTDGAYVAKKPPMPSTQNLSFPTPPGSQQHEQKQGNQQPTQDAKKPPMPSTQNLSFPAPPGSQQHEQKQGNQQPKQDAKKPPMPSTQNLSFPTPPGSQQHEQKQGDQQPTQEAKKPPLPTAQTMSFPTPPGSQQHEQKQGNQQPKQDAKKPPLPSGETMSFPTPPGSQQHHQEQDQKRKQADQNEDHSSFSHAFEAKNPPMSAPNPVSFKPAGSSDLPQQQSDGNVRMKEEPNTSQVPQNQHGGLFQPSQIGTSLQQASMDFQSTNSKPGFSSSATSPFQQNQAFKTGSSTPGGDSASPAVFTSGSPFQQQQHPPVFQQQNTFNTQASSGGVQLTASAQAAKSPFGGGGAASTSTTQPQQSGFGGSGFGSFANSGSGNAFAQTAQSGAGFGSPGGGFAQTSSGRQIFGGSGQPQQQQGSGFSAFGGSSQQSQRQQGSFSKQGQQDSIWQMRR